MAQSILVAEDERNLVEALSFLMQRAGYEVHVARDGPATVEMTRRLSPDLVLLDIMLPGLNGFEIARRLRQANSRTPLLMLTARDATVDVIKGLDVGADDYLTKPFDFEVLLARLRAVARRGPVEQLPKLKVADLTLDPATHRVTRAGKRIHLTRTEHQLLEVLMRQASHVLSRSAIVEAVWGFDSSIGDNTLDAFIRLLRNKVDAGHATKLIHTIRGVGYVLQEEDPS